MKEEPRAAGPLDTAGLDPAVLDTAPLDTAGLDPTVLDTAGLDPAVLDPAMAATSASTRKMPVDEESPRGPADPW
jgi:hypothetical protein